MVVEHESGQHSEEKRTYKVDGHRPRRKAEVESAADRPISYESGRRSSAAGETDPENVCGIHEVSPISSTSGSTGSPSPGLDRERQEAATMPKVATASPPTIDRIT